MRRKILLTSFILLAIVFTFASCNLVKGSEESKCTHTTVSENRIESTCTKEGSYDSVIYCTVCEEEFSRKNIIIPATGHNYENGTCSVCGEAEYVSTGNEYVRCNKDGTPNANGNYILFGEYPQTIKADNVTITSTTDDRGYYLGSDGYYYAKVTATPHESGYKFSNGTNVTNGAVYYFKVEPIRWRILEEKNGNAFILCDSIIVNQAYQSTYTVSNGNYYTNADSTPLGTYANNYMYSDVRAWLNSTFYEMAFSEIEQKIIFTTVVDNGLKTTGYTNNPFVCDNTNDKIFIPSFVDTINSDYGFHSSSNTCDTARRMLTSDYSRAVGACMSVDSEYYGSGIWYSRSPYVSAYGNKDGYLIRGAYYTGSVIYDWGISYSHFGVVPALCINVGEVHTHVYVDGYCSCGESDPDFEENLNASEGLSYSYSNGSYTVTGIGTCTDSNVVIPAAYNGYPVVAIADNAFSSVSQIKSVVIPDSVYTIGENAFYSCKNLVNITIGRHVNYIGNNAFYYSTALKNVYIFDVGKWCSINCVNTSSNPLFYASNLYINGSLVKDVVIPEGVTSICHSAFAGTSLESVTMPNSVKTIGAFAFYNTEIKEIVFSNQLTEIGWAVLSDCSKLEKVVIPDSVIKIADAVFIDCVKLRTIVIPDSVTSIGWNVFHGCTGLESIVIGSGLKSIDHGTFTNCTKLSNVYYRGTQAQWNSISINSSGNTALTSAKRYYFSSTLPETSGNYWYYDENDNITIW